MWFNIGHFFGVKSIDKSVLHRTTALAMIVQYLGDRDLPGASIHEYLNAVRDHYLADFV